jgi:glycosyltransferase involved in cell wall biosynthesis
MGNLVSVIIPTHNRGDLLRRSIASVLNQKHQEFEIIVADDASEENIGEVVASFGDQRIKHFRNEQKTHAGGARNLGLDHATGDYIAFLDSDDEWLPEHLASHLNAIVQSGCDGVYGSVFIDDGESRTYVGSRAMPLGQHPADYVLSGGSVPTPTWVMKSSAVKSLRFDRELVIHEDYDFFVRFASNHHWLAMWQPTTIVHWQKGVQRKRNPHSEIKFVQRYYQHIAPRTYFMYHLSNLTDYRKLGVDQNILHYYTAEALRHINAISFNDYCAVFNQRRGAMGFVINLLGFMFRLLQAKVSKPGPPKGLD